MQYKFANSKFILSRLYGLSFDMSTRYSIPGISYDTIGYRP